MKIMKNIASIVIAVAAYATICLGDGNNSAPNPEKEQYILATVSGLRDFTPQENSPSAEIMESGYIQKKYDGDSDIFGIPNNAGSALIRFPDGWLYIVTHSTHLNEDIGDICLAIDDTAHIYENDGHVCGGIRFQSTNDSSPAKSASDFVSRYNTYLSGISWKAWPEKQNSVQQSGPAYPPQGVGSADP